MHGAHTPRRYYLISQFCSAGLYLLYAKLEEEHGMARHAMAVYERATKGVLPEEMFEVRKIRLCYFPFFIIICTSQFEE
jgi:hypothetical protein